MLSPEASADLREIWHYIANDGGEDIANKVADQIDDAILKLAAMPGLGRTRRDVKDQRYRFWNVNRFVIAYLPETDPLWIVRVVGGRRDFRKLF